MKKKAVSKKTAKKKVTKKKTAKRTTGAASKKTARKATKKSIAKKTAKKAATKKTARKTVKKAAKKPASKKPVSKKPAPKKPTPKKTEPKKPASKAPVAKPGKGSEPKGAAAGGKTPDSGKQTSGRKGITIVSKRPMRRPKPKPVSRDFTAPGDRLLQPGSPVRKPLIPSGPKATPIERPVEDEPKRPAKSPFSKRELTKYRKILVAKRAELLGDMEKIESDALRSESGDLSHFPQHMADQGSDNFEQSLSLNLAAVDRRLIQDIDDALQRIEDRVYGICEMTGKPINVARLNELPWARYSIEAARELERRGGR